MNNRHPQPQVVFVYGDGSTYPDVGTYAHSAGTGQKFEDQSEQDFRQEAKSGPKSTESAQTGFSSEQRSGGFPHAAHAEILSRGAAVPHYDPYQVHRDFPKRWQTYIRANFSGTPHVQQVFGVSERTARKWWNGESGANGGHVAIAMRATPITATRMLFAAE